MKGAVIDRLSDEDTQILRLGHGVIQGHTCKVLLLDRIAGQPPPSLQAIRDRVESRLDATPRMRRRVWGVPLRVANPIWVDDPSFDIAHHITAAHTDRELTREELNELVAQLMAEPLASDRPLWHIAVVERVEPEVMALIWRLHHCLADGTTAMRLAETLLWDTDQPESLAGPVAWHPDPVPSRWSLFADGLAHRLRGRPARGTASPHPGSDAADLGSGAATKSVLSRELAPTASLTRLAKKVGAARRVAFASAPLEPLHAAGKSISEAVTINDVVLAIVSGGVREWLGPSESIRVKVPVSLHHPGEAAGVANSDSYFFVDLPVAETDPVKRVLAINRETRERKLSGDAETLYRLGAHHRVATRAMSPQVFTFNVSNVRGPSGEVKVLGARLGELYTLAEIAQRHVLRIAVISASASLFFGLCADLAAVPDLDELSKGICQAADELLAHTG